MSGRAECDHNNEVSVTPLNTDDEWRSFSKTNSKMNSFINKRPKMVLNFNESKPTCGSLNRARRMFFVRVFRSKYIGILNVFCVCMLFCMLARSICIVRQNDTAHVQMQFFYRFVNTTAHRVIPLLFPERDRRRTK